MMRSRPSTKRGAIAYGRAECCGFPRLKPPARENVSYIFGSPLCARGDVSSFFPKDIIDGWVLV